MVPAMALAACGGGEDGAAVEGTFAPGLAPTGVWVVESERSEPADSAGFALADLTPGPVSLRLMNGTDTAAVLNLSGLAPGARLRLEGLRVDRESGMAFPRTVQLDGDDGVTVNGPRTVQLDGDDGVTVNGLRMAPDSRVPREVDVRGAVLAWSSEHGALLVRPDEARLPDLRVIVGLATQVVGEDGGGADATTLQPGDSIRVEGRSENGYVVASRLTVPTRVATLIGTGDDGAASRDGESGGASAAAPIPRGGSAAPAPRIISDDGRGRDDRPGRGRGQGKGKGKGKG
jgi:hypothetical protein